MIILRFIVNLARLWGFTPYWLRFGLPLLILAAAGIIQIANGRWDERIQVAYLVGAVFLVLSLWATNEVDPMDGLNGPSESD